MSIIVELAKNGVLRNKNFRTEYETKSFFYELNKAPAQLTISKIFNVYCPSQRTANYLAF